MCVLFHDAYEAAAIKAGWETQKRSRVPWSEVPEANKETMRVTIRAVIASDLFRALVVRTLPAAKLHAPLSGPPSHTRWCASCRAGTEWPCPTIAALEQKPASVMRLLDTG